MAGQAGWYRAPGEEGLLRYWNGTIWTEHRQPDPAAAPAPEPEDHASDQDLDPMAEYEKQFASPSVSDSVFDQVTRDFGSHPFTTATDAPSTWVDPVGPGTEVVVSTPQPQYRPQAALTSSPVVPAPKPEFAGSASTAPRSLGPIALGPVAAAATPIKDAPRSEFDQMFDDLTALAAAPETSATPVIVATPVVAAAAAAEDSHAEPAAQVAVGIAPNRKAVLGAARIMAAAIILILLGVGAMVFFSLASTAAPGDVKTNAIVTSLGATTGNSCTPVARFAVAGKSYTANSSSSITPCPIGLGESVDVVYSAANPASAARIEVGGSIAQYLWIAPILGGLVFVGGLITFIIRAGSIVAGVALLRKRTDHSDVVPES